MRLGELISPAKVSRCGNRTLPILSITKLDGIVLQSEKFKKVIASKDVSNYKVVPRGMLVQGIHIDEANFGIQNLTDEGIVSPAYKIWRVNEQLVLPEYLAAALRSEYCISYYKKNLSGTVHRRGRISNEVFYALEINVPSLDEQLKSMQALDEVLVEQKAFSRQIYKLDELVKSRFVEMFGDPLENPFGWDAQPLGKLGELRNGVNFKSVDSGTDIRCLGVSDFKDRYQISDMELVSIISLNGKPNKNQMLRDGDIVFVRSNGNKQLVGRCLAVFPGDEEVTFSGFCIRFRNESDRLLLDYLLGCLKSDSMRKTMTGRGANIQNLSQKILSRVVIPMPPLALQQEFAAFVQQVDKLRHETQQAIDKLQMLYDSLAQEYFSE